MLLALLRVALILIGLFGVLLAVAGAWALASGTSIALPGLGIIVGGGALLLFGLMLVGLAALGLLLARPSRPFR
ncbi:MAG TPA: hypothetical protein VGB73_11095 [Pyrinomonadaceae bacterium]|jgi:hypothetical protein